VIAVVMSLVGGAALVAGITLGPGVLGWVLGTRDPAARSEGVTRRVLPIQGRVTLSPDGRTLAALGNAGTVELWDVESGTVRQVLRVATGGRQVALAKVVFAPDGSTLATLPPAGWTIQIWDAETGSPHSPIQVPATCSALAPLRASDLVYSPDGRSIATTGDCLRLWDVATGTLLHQIDIPAVGAAFAPDGKTIAGVAERQSGIWDVATGAPVQSFALPADGQHHGWYGWTVRFAPDGRTVVTNGDETRAWDPVTGLLKWSRVTLAHGLAFAPDGSLLAESSLDTVWLVDPATGTRLRELPGLAGLLVWGGSNQQVDQMAWAPDSRTLAVSHRGGLGSWSRAPQIWDVETGTALQVLKGHSGDVSHLEYAPDSRTLITASADRTVRIWQMP
jgi:WD40 repeat protein